MAVSYNTTAISVVHMYSTTGGGTTFGSDLKGLATFNYFSTSATVNDCLYVTCGTTMWSDIEFDVGTAISATGLTMVWEYFRGDTAAWTTIPNTKDDTNGFTTLGLNRFRFAYPLNYGTTSVNGYNGVWVRCRITAVTSITNGGANVTTIPTGYDGVINVKTSSETSTSIVNYMQANYSYAQAQQIGRWTDLRWFSLNCAYFVTFEDEFIEIGPVTATNYVVNSFRGVSFQYATLGVKTTENGLSVGTNGAYVIINAYNPSGGGLNNPCVGTYASVIKGLPDIGYPNMQGDYVDSQFDFRGLAYSNSASMNNCLIISRYGIVEGFPATYEYNKNTITGTAFGLYQNGGTFNQFNYGWLSASGNNFFTFYQTYTDIQLDFIDPVQPLPGLTDPNYLFGFNTSTHTPKIVYYDASTSTYTDYTGASSIPLGGIAGSAIYIDQLSYCIGPYITFTIATQTNNYTYVAEYYYNGSWTAFTETWDRTNNLTETGNYYLGGHNFAQWTSTTIGPYTSNWVRFRIVTAGTGSPTAQGINTVSIAGLSNWALNVYYTLNLTVLDTSENIISGANVEIIDSTGATVFTGTTDANGNATYQALNSKYNINPPVGTIANYYEMIGETTYGDYTVKVSNAGYLTSVSKIPMTETRNEVITLSRPKAINMSRSIIQSEV